MNIERASEESVGRAFWRITCVSFGEFGTVHIGLFTLDTSSLGPAKQLHRGFRFRYESAHVKT